MVQTTNSTEETQQLAKSLANRYKSQGGIITLSGELGAGKTTFVQGFAKGLAIKDRIISPTFTLIRQHQIPNSQRTLFHIDLYRLDKPAEISTLGLEDIFADKDAIVLIEWPEKLKEFPKKSLRISINKTSENKRTIKIED